MLIHENLLRCSSSLDLHGHHSHGDVTRKLRRAGGTEPCSLQTGRRAGSHTLWGLPLAVAQDGTVLGCAPQALHDAPVTDRLAAEATDIIGATNAPTGWRGGTGRLELLFRDKSGNVQWQAVASGALTAGPACWAQEPPGPRQRLQYYRLAPPAP